MKKFLCMGGLMLGLIFSNTSIAQDTDHTTTGQKIKKTTKKVGQKTEQGAKKVGNKTAEVASKSKAKITDERYKDKVGPNGETVYIDNHSKYYWVDKKGRRHYVTEAELKAKG